MRPSRKCSGDHRQPARSRGLRLAKVIHGKHEVSRQHYSTTARRREGDSMKRILFCTVMLATLCAVAQQSSQPKSNDQPAPPPARSDAQKTDSQANPAPQPQAELKAPLLDKGGATDESAA